MNCSCHNRESRDSSNFAEQTGHVVETVTFFFTLKVNQDAPGTIVLHVFLLRRHLGMLSRVGVRCQIFNLNPIRKICNKNDVPFVYKKFQKLSSYLSVKVVRNSSGKKYRRKRKQYIPLIAVKQQTLVYSRPGLICLTIFLIRSLK